MSQRRHGGERIPPVAAWLVTRLLPPASRRDVLGDLDEQFRRLRRAHGRPRAWAWYWRQAIAFAWKLPAAGIAGGLPKDSRREPNLTGNVVADVRYAVRGLVAEPFFAFVVIATLALAVGANTAIFSVVNGVLLSPLDYPEPDRLVRLYQYYSSSGQFESAPDNDDVVSPIDYIDYRDQLSIFQSLVGMGNYDPTGFDLTGDGPPQRISSLRVTSDYFDVYGVRPLTGRVFERADEDGGSRVVILSAGLWRNLFDLDPKILGRTITLDGEAWEIVGVMPAGFVDLVGGDVDVWAPHDMTPGGFNVRDNHYMTVVGRLAPEVELAEAQQQLTAFDEELGRLYPESNDGRYALLRPLHDDSVGNADTMLWVLLGSTVLVLLIGCVNVANLLISRGIARRRELAIRAALGSGRLRLVRQLLTEGVLLALIGGAAGVALATMTTRALLRLAPQSLTLINDVSFDSRVLAFALVTSLVTAVVFGLVPALRTAGKDLETAVREGGRGNSSGKGTHRMRAALVVSEVALALVLLVGAGLMLRSFWLLQTRDAGVDPGAVTTFELRLPPARYDSTQERQDFYQELQSRIVTIPGVERAGAVQWLPVTGTYNVWGYGIADPNSDDGWDFHTANVRVISGDYLDVVGIPLLAGRRFGPDDALGAPWAVYLNQAAVADGWGPGVDPIGKIIKTGGRDSEVIGIVGDTLLRQRSSTPTPKVYFSHAQFAERHWNMFQLVRTSGEVPRLVTAIRTQIADIDPQLVAFNVRTLERAIGSGVADTRFAMVLLMTFGVIAGLLAAIGTYGVLSYSVGQRRREIGIRLALGAHPRQIQRMVLGQGLGFAALGATIGLAAAFVATRLMSSLLYGVTATDPGVFVAVGAAGLAIALLAAWIPARRATRVSPVRALR